MCWLLLSFLPSRNGITENNDLRHMEVPNDDAHRSTIVGGTIVLDEELVVVLKGRQRGELGPDLS